MDLRRGTNLLIPANCQPEEVKKKVGEKKKKNLKKRTLGKSY